MPRMITWIVCTVVLAAVSSACQPAPPQPSSTPSETERAQIEQRVQQYFTKTVNLPPDVTMKLNDVSPAPIGGLLTANLEVSNGTNSQKIAVVVSRDGRFLIQGQLTDLTIDPYKAAMEKITLKDEPSRGNPSATVTIVEYSDFQCPFCSRAYAMVEEQLLKEYRDKVRFVFKNFPLSEMHPWAENAALASQCARQQSGEGFWKVYDFLFQNQETITEANLKEKAEGVLRDAGLDVTKFDACFDGKAALDVVKAQAAEADALGVRSTPTFFINGRKLEGALPYEQFKSAVDQALAQALAQAQAQAPAQAPAGA
jgi:protein-disulfide isomerase